MPIDEQKLASLLHHLEGAALALGGSALDAEARQQVCTRLSPAAQHMLEAFKGFTLPPPVVAAASRASCDIERFPEDVLGALLAFVDLPMRFTCVVASRTLRDACMRLSPRLEHELVLKRCPLLRTLPVGTSLAGVPAPRELFRSYRGRFNRRSFSSRRPEPSISLDAYTLSLELEATYGMGTPRKSVYVGSRAISPQVPGQGICATFNIPEGLYERALDEPRFPHRRFSANVMVSRRSQTGRVQFARLYSGVIGDNDSFGFCFDNDDLPYASDNTALQFIRFRTDHTDMWMDPSLDLRWDAVQAARPSVLHVSFVWRTTEDDDIMGERDIANCLEHFVDWSD